MTFEICVKRKTIIDTTEHALVVGGPGSGKTTLALLKSRELIPELELGQSVLFLSFSRAAVQQILERCKEIFSKEEMKRIDVRTYHSFCWDILRSHGGLLGGKRMKMMSPSDEGIKRTMFVGDWAEESRRMLGEDGIVCFDQFAPATAALFGRSKHLRDWMGRLYPLVIFDEFQDSDDEQWLFVQELCLVTQTLFLADPDQQIFGGGFRPGVRSDRLDILKATISLKEIDLTNDNYRSADSEILAYANAVYSGVAPLPKTKDVKTLSYNSFNNIFKSSVHFAVAVTRAELRRRGIEKPKMAVLARSNDLVAEISDILQLQHSYNDRTLKPIPHEVVWDQLLSAAAGEVIAAALEYKSSDVETSGHFIHKKVYEYFLMKKDHCEQYGGRGAKGAMDKAERFLTAQTHKKEGKAVRRGAPKELELALNASPDLLGDPVADWKTVRAAFQSHRDLKSIFQDARMLRLFRASDVLASSLSNLWVSQASYSGAARALKRVLDRERVMGMDSQPEGVSLMTIHKSKGKEYDGVVLVEGQYASPFFLQHEAPEFAASRRLLRVGISRARHLVILVRPKNAQVLVS